MVDLQELIEFFNGAILAVTGNAVHQDGFEAD